MQNNRRYDLSDRLIHFFRDVDESSLDSPETPQHWGYASVAEDWTRPAIFLLRHAIRQGRLWATWSIRGGKRTIYGPRPAVCLTEMPIAAFVEASQLRAAKGEAMSSFALVLPKAAAFAAGARPVIYGLSKSASPSGGKGGGPRIFADTVLPADEQYRYVSYNPTAGNLDWTHEREWRWPLSAPSWHDEDGLPPGDSDDLPGLILDQTSMRGLGVIVATELQAQQVIYDIITKVDRGEVAKDHYQFVLAHETIPNWSKLRDHGRMEKAISKRLIDLAPYFSIKKARAKALAAAFDLLVTEIDEAAGTKASDGIWENGATWLWVVGNRNELVRALIREGRVSVNKEGKYLVDLPQFHKNRSIRRQQELADLVGAEIEKRYGLRATYYTVIGSTDPNAIPYYNGDMLDDEFHYNETWTGTSEDTDGD